MAQFKFRNFYKCSKCGHEWYMDWHSTCNDRCPQCNTETKPAISEDLKQKLYPKFIRDVHCANEYADDYPSQALIEITPALYKWIKKAQKALKGLEATYIQKFE
jgi:hypothetical protein